MFSNADLHDMQCKCNSFVHEARKEGGKGAWGPKDSEASHGNLDIDVHIRSVTNEDFTFRFFDFRNQRPASISRFIQICYKVAYIDSQKLHRNHVWLSYPKDSAQCGRYLLAWFALRSQGCRFTRESFACIKSTYIHIYTYVHICK